MAEPAADLSPHRRALHPLNSEAVARRRSRSSCSPNAGRRLLHIPTSSPEEESDDEVFFGVVTEAELKKAAKLKNRRRTAIHNAAVGDTAQRKRLAQYAAITIQSWCRRWSAQRLFRILRCAAITLQRAWRTRKLKLALRWYGLLIRTKRVWAARRIQHAWRRHRKAKSLLAAPTAIMAVSPGRGSHARHAAVPQGHTLTAPAGLNIPAAGAGPSLPAAALTNEGIRAKLEQLRIMRETRQRLEMMIQVNPETSMAPALAPAAAVPVSVALTALAPVAAMPTSIALAAAPAPGHMLAALHHAVAQPSGPTTSSVVAALVHRAHSQSAAMSPSKVLAAGRAAAGRLGSGIPMLSRARQVVRHDEEAGLTMITLRNTVSNSRRPEVLASLDDVVVTDRAISIRWHSVLTTADPAKPLRLSGQPKSILKRRADSSGAEM
eukprot:m.135400 g.135400  ORF g.135400 m.135400 type:complete len:436 (+) comp9526_c0_seq2:33-1340(+)